MGDGERDRPACAECREVVSARLDGEAGRAEIDRAETHLAGCAPCREFAEQAARVTRRVRMEPVGSVPDLADAVSAALDAGGVGGTGGTGEVGGAAGAGAAGAGLGAGATVGLGATGDVAGPGPAAGAGAAGAGLGAGATVGLGATGGVAGAGPAAGAGAAGTGALGPGAGVAADRGATGHNPVGAGAAGGGATGRGAGSGPGATTDLSAAGRAATAGRDSRRRATDLVRLGLGAAAAAQVALVVSGVVTVGQAHHGGGQLAGASAAHLVHESSAWNLALGVAFAVAAAARTRPAGMVPVVGAFVGMLALLSAVDVLAGRVDPGRLVGHVVVLTGFVLLLLLCRLDRGGRGAARRLDDAGTRRLARTAGSASPEGLRLLRSPTVEAVGRPRRVAERVRRLISAA